MKQPDQGIGCSSHRSEHVQLRLIGKDEYRKGVVHASVPFQNADADELIAIGGLGSRAVDCRPVSFGRRMPIAFDRHRPVGDSRHAREDR